ncbi:hypothetical protein G5I_09228 [Acromyrmex echinatior]|uniref:Uncharacterized protein n=1 Tax=Acromyrmex echinatior TaxID=103372 RepID=F4WTM2_ACREC|nr:hypothetical protein G5I_09228 [Acromyrmex echinatior]
MPDRKQKFHWGLIPLASEQPSDRKQAGNTCVSIMRREIDRDATVTSHFASSRILSSFPGKALRPRYPCEYRTSQRYFSKTVFFCAVAGVNSTIITSTN